VPPEDEPAVVAGRFVARRIALDTGAGVAATSFAAPARSERAEAAREHAQGSPTSV